MREEILLLSYDKVGGGGGREGKEFIKINSSKQRQIDNLKIWRMKNDNLFLSFQRKLKPNSTSASVQI